MEGYLWAEVSEKFPEIRMEIEVLSLSRSHLGQIRMIIRRTVIRSIGRCLVSKYLKNDGKSPD
jgi:hypothetical protein